MKTFITAISLFCLLIYSSCISIGNSCDSILDATFICDAVDYYTHDPVKGLSIYIRADHTNLTESKVTTDEKGQAAPVSKKAIGSCEQPIRVYVMPDMNDTSLMCTNRFAYEYIEPKGNKFISFQCKTRSLPILLKIAHKNTDTDSLSFSFDYNILSTLHLFPKSINSKRIFDSTYIFKVFPETSYDYSFSYVDKTGNRKLNKFSNQQTLRQDTFKINIEY